MAVKDWAWPATVKTKTSLTDVTNRYREREGKEEKDGVGVVNHAYFQRNNFPA